MLDVIYVEKEVENHPRTRRFLTRFSQSTKVLINRYSEIFNRSGQNFRLQKNLSSLIIAKKYGKFLHEIPKNYGIGKERNFYFSHLLNCPYDCQYCFLQGLYRSSFFVWFINYEDFQEEIAHVIKQSEKSATFFTGYDGDSLAMEQTTYFIKDFLPFIASVPNAEFELRTKSVLVNPLLHCAPLNNCIIAYSLNPETISKNIETKTPPLKARLKSLIKLQTAGWPIGLRFDPIILHENFAKEYIPFFQNVLQSIDVKRLHSVTLGSFRLPPDVYRNMRKNSPHDKLLATLTRQNGFFAYPAAIEQKMIDQSLGEILRFVPKEKVFLCNDDQS